MHKELDKTSEPSLRRKTEFSFKLTFSWNSITEFDLIQRTFPTISETPQRYHLSDYNFKVDGNDGYYLPSIMSLLYGRSGQPSKFDHYERKGKLKLFHRNPLTSNWICSPSCKESEWQPTVLKSLSRPGQ